jgi:hypothetical protein
MGGGAAAVVTRAVAAALVALAALLLDAARAESHALHVSYADVTFASGEVRVALRVYTDDLGRAAGRAGALAYVGAHFVLVGGTGGPVRLAACGATTQGDMTHLCLRATFTDGPRGARLTNDILLADYGDQVNVVRVSGGRTLLFTRDRRAQGL